MNILKIFRVLFCVVFISSINATEYIIEQCTNINFGLKCHISKGNIKYQYYNNYGKNNNDVKFDLSDILDYLKYRNQDLPTTQDKLDIFMHSFNQYAEQVWNMSLCFNDIRSALWKIKYSILIDGKYPKEVLNNILAFCKLVNNSNDSEELKKKRAVINMIFSEDGLYEVTNELQNLINFAEARGGRVNTLKKNQLKLLEEVKQMKNDCCG